MSDQAANGTSLDIGEIINYEGLYTVDILDPRTEEPLGVKVTLRSAGSAKAKKVLRAHQKERLERFQRNKLNVDVEKMEKQEEERVASCIEHWDWGSHTYKGEKPENTMRWYLRLMNEQPWFFNQCKEAAEKPENFPGNSATS
mgnify:CR=1 FL=1